MHFPPFPTFFHMISNLSITFFFSSRASLDDEKFKKFYMQGAHHLIVFILRVTCSVLMVRYFTRLTVWNYQQPHIMETDLLLLQES